MGMSISLGRVVMDVENTKMFEFDYEKHLNRFLGNEQGRMNHFYQKNPLFLSCLGNLKIIRCTKLLTSQGTKFDIIKPKNYRF